MDMTKHFIEFCDHIFPLESVICVERFNCWTDDNGEKKWKSLLGLEDGKYFYFPESEYEKIKNILIKFKNKNFE